jgi:hypothetical protein
MTDIEKIDKLITHIRAVQDNALILGRKLIEKGDVAFGKTLIVNSMSHDLTKFYGLEYENLHKDAEKEDLKDAIFQHQSSNPHHIEFWQSHDKVPDIFIAEFCCDTLARAQELASDYLNWLANDATKRYNFTTKSQFYKKVIKYYNLIIDNPFKK